MCGIAGIVDFNKGITKDHMNTMIQPLSHRGPDDQGILIKEFNNAFIGLGQKRLSIIDLSEAGHQPMSFLNVDIVLNGEIYNYKEIRAELLKLGYTFTSDSDTEVVLKAFHCWELQCVDRFIGMFAFCILDHKNEKLYLCRDRMGVKPLYYYYKDNTFLFASELKSFLKLPIFKPEINKMAVKSFLQFGYIQTPDSIFHHTFKLKKGSWGIMDCRHNIFKIQEYWNIQHFFNMGNIDISYEQAVAECEKLLISSCKYRMVSDVPVGIFLSGGYDSTLVTSILAKNGFNTLHTYTIGFSDGIDESADAKKIADYLGSVHTSFDCTLGEAKKIIPDLPIYYDEPCGDISCIPTILVSKLASKDVKVALSADGGDELFAGYDGYSIALKRLHQMNSIPVLFRGIIHVFSDINRKINSNDSVAHKLKGWADYYDSGNNVHKFILNSSKIPDAIIYRLMNNVGDVSTEFIHNIADTGNNILLSNIETSLPDYLLAKVDRATMSASLEAREPLLDHRLAEFTARLPFHYKNDGKTSKRIIKDIVHKYVPEELMNRPKTGFDLPVFKWLKTDLSFLLHEYLNEESIKMSDLFNYSEVSNLINQFRRNKLVYQNIIWNLLCFQMWYMTWMRKVDNI